MTTAVKDRVSRTSLLANQFRRVREFTIALCEPLSAEDCSIQSMPDVSPTRWHLAHTTWFFENFVLAQQAEYEQFDPTFNYLFNSYYNAVGEQFPRSSRGLISRPTLAEVLDYRRHVDDALLRLLSHDEQVAAHVWDVIELGLQHEQQHQELILTDIKHVLAHNPLHPVYRGARPIRIEELRGGAGDVAWPCFDEGIYWIGHEADAFAYDNEGPRHRVFLEAFELAPRLVTCGEYLAFMRDGGYARPELWLSLGWQKVRECDWRAPLYWREKDGRWQQFTLAGLRDVVDAEPVCHLSYFEADAFARWADARLPTEAEWEVASVALSSNENAAVFIDTLMADEAAIHPQAETDAHPSLLGNAWQWTASSYSPYPGYQPAPGAIGEYNGKFMCQQLVLRGGSCATHSSHIRTTYRNFFPPDARWQFAGLRLARGAK